METSLAVELPAVLYQDLSSGQASEPLPIGQLVPQLSVETLHKSVRQRLSGAIDRSDR